MPIGVAGAVALGVGVLGAGATMYASGQQSDAIGDAQDSANRRQDAAQAQMRGDLMPYMDTGRNALMVAGNLSGANGVDAATGAMADFQHSPGYEFALKEGLRAVNSNSAAAGMAASGANMKALQERGAGIASQDFAQYYNRLLGLTQIGQASAAGVGASGVQTAAGQAQTDVSAGGTQASIYGNAASGVGNAVNNGMNNYMYGQKTNSLYSKPEAANADMSGGGLKGW